MPEMTLYGYWRSSCSYRVRIAMHWKGIDFENVPIHLVRDGGEQHATTYRRLNPMEQVPCLIHQEVAISQSMAIFEYLETIHPTPSLFPADPLISAKVRQLCETINAGIQPLQNLSVLQYLKAHQGVDDEGVQLWSRHWIDRGFHALDRMLSVTAGRYCVGDEVTAADAFLIPQVYNANRFNLALEDYPQIARIVPALEALEAFQKAEPSRQGDAPAAD